jgi:hypothetical protein
MSDIFAAGTLALPIGRDRLLTLEGERASNARAWRWFEGVRVAWPHAFPPDTLAAGVAALGPLADAVRRATLDGEDVTDIWRRLARDAAMARQLADRAARRGHAPPPTGGLFDEDAAAQGSLF